MQNIAKLALVICSVLISISSIAQNNKSLTSTSYLENKIKADSACKQGELFMQQKRYSEAYSSFSDALRLNIEAKSLCKRAACLIMLNDTSKALLDVDSAITIDSTIAEAYFLKATIYHMNNKEQISIQLCSLAIQHDPKYIDAYVLRGLLYKLCKMNKLACEDLSYASSLGSKKALEYFNQICDK